MHTCVHTSPARPCRQPLIVRALGLADRAVVLTGRGFDLSAESRSVVIRCDPLETQEACPWCELPPLGQRVRLFLEGTFHFRLIDERRILLQQIQILDARMPAAPPAVVNFIAKGVIPAQVT